MSGKVIILLLVTTATTYANEIDLVFCSRRDGLQGPWFKYCLWTFRLCWKDLSTFPKVLLMATLHSPSCNCLFSPLEISINPAQALLLTHHMPLPSLSFCMKYPTKPDTELALSPSPSQLFSTC